MSQLLPAAGNSYYWTSYVTNFSHFLSSDVSHILWRFTNCKDQSIIFHLKLFSLSNSNQLSSPFSQTSLQQPVEKGGWSEAWLCSVYRGGTQWPLYGSFPSCLARPPSEKMWFFYADEMTYIWTENVLKHLYKSTIIFESYWFRHLLNICCCHSNINKITIVVGQYCWGSQTVAVWGIMLFNHIKSAQSQIFAVVLEVILDHLTS